MNIYLHIVVGHSVGQMGRFDDGLCFCRCRNDFSGIGMEERYLNRSYEPGNSPTIYINYIIFNLFIYNQGTPLARPHRL